MSVPESREAAALAPGQDRAAAAATAWPDIAGRLTRGLDGEPGHVLAVRVYFEDTDFSGLVYHGSYVRWCERGRSDFLRLVGNDHRRLLDGSGGREPAAFVVRRMAIEFLRPARIDEILEVTTRVKETGAAHLVLDQRVQRDGVPIFTAEVTVVLISLSGKPLRIARELRSAFSGPAGGAGGGASP
jgi:acyl-CoA thioester hydrolase